MPSKGRENIKVGGREMRRIAILVIVLLISISASAAVQIAVNGVGNPSEITLFPSDLANISIVTDSVINYEGFYGLLGVPQGEPGSIAWGQYPPIIQPYVSIIPGPEPPIPGFSSWIEFAVFPDISGAPAGTILIDGIDFHCEGPGNVHLTLLTTQDYVDWVVNDIQAISQPEPATIALLGLGAMLLKRRM
jgi:hypothetical protein